MSRLAHAATIALIALAPACTGARGQGGPKSPKVPHGPIHAVAVDDAQFAPKLHQLLIEGAPSQDRMNLLVGVVRRQLARAEDRFQRGHRDAGMAAVTGAFYLVRPDELRNEMLDGASRTLGYASREVARVGDEGRSRALYGMLLRSQTGNARRDTQTHLSDLERWAKSTQKPGTMQSYGAIQASAVRRALLEPTPANVDAAKQATVAWIRQSFELGSENMQPRSHFEREEAISALRARRAGAATLVALYLRFGDSAGALEALEEAELTQLVHPGIHERLEAIVEAQDPEAIWDLAQLYESAKTPDLPETAIDPLLADAASWGATLQLYRVDPNSIRSGLAMAQRLLDFGMAEAAPIALEGALGGDPGPREASAALALLHQAIVTQSDLGDAAGARRTFQAAKNVVALADAPPLVGRVRPSAARLRYVIGAIETRAGELDHARPHIAASVKTEPSIAAFSLLASIDRQRGDSKAALSSLDALIALARAGKDPLSEGEAHLTAYEIHRDSGNAEANKSLEQALRRILEARKLLRSAPALARSERLLARVLDHYGEAKGARRATDRAYEIAGANLHEITATAIEAARRAVTRVDLKDARAAARRAIEANLEDEDIVYVALWLLLVERTLGDAGDGTVERALSKIEDRSGWPAKLRGWATGKVTDADLLNRAQSTIERVEARFYIAMMARAKGNKKDALVELENVAKSAAIDLVEVTIARDLIASSKSLPRAKLPPGVTLP